MNDGSVEFGGNDLLHVYNVAQLKHRLNTTGLYIACTKQVHLLSSECKTNPQSNLEAIRWILDSSY